MLDSITKVEIYEEDFIFVNRSLYDDFSFSYIKHGNSTFTIKMIDGTENTYNCGKISSLEFTKRLTNLSSLVVEYNQVSDISLLSGLTNLRRLNLESNQISDISSLSGLKKLETLLSYDNLTQSQIDEPKKQSPRL